MARLTSFEPGWRAAVIGASGAIGGAIAAALEADADASAVLRFSRSAGDIDLFDEPSLAAAAEAAVELDLVFIATGALTINGVGPEKRLSELDPDALMAQFRLNAIGPALVIKHFAPKLASGHKTALAALSARVGSIGDNRLGGWHSYRAAKAALNQIIRGAAIEIARRRPQAVVAALHPGTVESPLTRRFRPEGAGAEGVVTPQTAAENLLGALDALTPAQSGGFFDYAGREIPW